MSTSRPVLSVALALTLAAPIAGCGSKSSGPDATARPEATQVAQAPQAPQVATGAFQAGQHLMVDWQGKVYPATVVALVGPDRAKIHYDNYGNNWDEVIGHDRVRGIAGGAAPAPAPQPGAVQAVDEWGRAADGLPANIPAGGSTPPSVAEWNSVQKEVTVRGSSALGCETKMLREWLKVTCMPNGAKIQPQSVSTKSSMGQQAYVGKFGDRTSLVVQVVEGKSYQAKFDWFDETASTTWSRTLNVNWIRGQRPEFHFDI